jgi:hypothetical protein
MPNKQYKKILHVATIEWAQESSKLKVGVKSYEVLKVMDLIVIN